MTLTDSQKQKIIEAQKNIAQYQFEIRQSQLEIIKKNFNKNLLTSLKKGQHHIIKENNKDTNDF